MTISSRTFELCFDGGYHPVTRRMYGSWEVRFNGFSKRVSRKELPGREISSSNVAEYLAALDALAWLESVRNKKQYDILVFSDSLLLVNQVLGKFKCHKEHLMILRNVISRDLHRFRVWNVHWRPRAKNVAQFGH